MILAINLAVAAGALVATEVGQAARFAAVPTAVERADRAVWTRHTIDDTSQGADGVKLGDLNGDGKLDLVTGWEEGGEVRVYLNPGPARSLQPGLV